ncbi:hypothetical protein ISF6_5509 [Piscinibacter sakaiensis]|uniref:Cytochrome P450 n=1 Tax=Piscinibacter sakaiensis TaxID=1547922 RepID=A0A0K8P9J3_PISS1|nr:hypothetical protein ISF6_5509 [Piscinibacter sakaiensis]
MYYLAGFDTRSARHYHRFYAEEAARQQAIDGCRYDVGDCLPSGPQAWQWSVRRDGPGGPVETEYCFLAWNDVIHAHWPRSALRVAAALLPAYVAFVRGGLLAGTRRLSRAFHWMLLLPALYSVAALLLAGLGAAGGAWVARAAGAAPWAAGAAAVAAALAVGGAGLALAERQRVYWLARAWIFMRAWARGLPVLDERWPAFAQRVEDDRRRDPVDETLLVGHSAGSMTAAMVAAHWLDQQPPCAHDASVKLMTIGSATPLLGLIPEAGWFRAAMRRVAESGMAWVDYTAPSDPLCYALIDPFRGCGVDIAAAPGYQAKSARFDRMFDPSRYHAIRRDFFAIHFQYLKATDHPVRNDYFSLTAGPLPLEAELGDTLKVTARPAGGADAAAGTGGRAGAEAGCGAGACPVAHRPPRPGPRSRIALLGGLFSRDGRSMLNLLPERAYTVQMGSATLAGQRLFLVNAPPTVREVLAERAADFPKHHYLAEILQPLIGISLFNANGADWARQRRLVDQAFALAGLRRAFPLMSAAVDDLLARCDAVADGRPWDADAAMSGVTADIIFRTLLSMPLTPQAAQRVHEDFRGYQANAQRVMGLSALRLPTRWHLARCRRQGAAIRAAFDAPIRARWAAVEAGAPDQPEDMLAALIAARDPDTGGRLGVDDLVDQVGTLFLAGHETSASTLAWALYLLACEPARQAALRADVQALWRDRPPAYGDTRALGRVHDVFRETLRLYPPIAFYLREAAAPTALRGKPVARGDMVAVSPWLVHRHRGLWERPDDFDPDRFDTPAGRASLRSAYLPFGDGPRACPGAAFATQESVLVLARLLQHHVIEPLPGAVPRPTARLTLRSANGVQLRLRRLPQAAAPAGPG